MGTLFEGVNADGTPGKGILTRMIYCAKCMAPLFRAVLETNIVLSTNSIAMSKSGCCDTNTISVLVVISEKQLYSELMPELSLIKRPKKEWQVKTWGPDGEVSLEHGPAVGSSKKKP